MKLHRHYLPWILLIVLLLAGCAKSLPDAAPVSVTRADGVSASLTLPGGWVAVPRGDTDAAARAFPATDPEVLPSLLQELEYDWFMLIAVPPESSGFYQRGLVLDVLDLSPYGDRYPADMTEAGDAETDAFLEMLLVKLDTPGEVTWQDVGNTRWAVVQDHTGEFLTDPDSGLPTGVTYATVRDGYYIRMEYYNAIEGLDDDAMQEAETVFSSLAVTLP